MTNPTPPILIQQITTRGCRNQCLLTCRACGWTSVQIKQLVDAAAIAHSNQCEAILSPARAATSA
jgi:hypothetical protein